MTKSTLKALWLGGGGVLATWLAVTPNPGVQNPGTAAGTAAARQPTAEDLNAQAALLRAQTSAVALRPSTRNPFRFSSPRSAQPARDRVSASPAAVAVPPPIVPLPPAFKLSGIAETKTPEGARRTAVISGDGQVYLAGIGDTVGDQYTVVTIDPEAVVLRDAGGIETRLSLR